VIVAQQGAHAGYALGRHGSLADHLGRRVAASTGAVASWGPSSGEELTGARGPKAALSWRGGARQPCGASRGFSFNPVHRRAVDREGIT
jgi:hypothetical protein